MLTGLVVKLVVGTVLIGVGSAVGLTIKEHM